MLFFLFSAYCFLVMGLGGFGLVGREMGMLSVKLLIAILYAVVCCYAEAMCTRRTYLQGIIEVLGYLSTLPGEHSKDRCYFKSTGGQYPRGKHEDLPRI